jgi:hypothetical protein
MLLLLLFVMQCDTTELRMCMVREYIIHGPGLALLNVLSVRYTTAHT